MNTNNYNEIEQFFYQLNTIAYSGNFERWAENKESISESMDTFFDIIDELILVEYREDFLVQLDKGSKFYRARIIGVDDYKHTDKGIGYTKERLIGYNGDESKEPPLEYCNKAQRNNPKGETALYVADDEITACAEIKSSVRQYISVAEFELNDNVVVLDFSKLQLSKPFYQYNGKYGVDVRRLLSTLVSYFSRPVYEDTEYIFSQKIVGHFREKGIKGFKYRSFYTSGNNYTFFDDEMQKFVWKDSRVLMNYATANLFVSLDRNKAVDLSNIDKIEQSISSDIREKMWNDTKKVWKPL